MFDDIPKYPPSLNDGILIPPAYPSKAVNLHAIDKLVERVAVDEVLMSDVFENASETAATARKQYCSIYAHATMRDASPKATLFSPCLRTAENMLHDRVFSYERTLYPPSIRELVEALV